MDELHVLFLSVKENHMKQLTKRIFPLFLSLILMLSAGMTALASGEGNIDGGGGGMGSGTATDVWHGQDGVRVTVVTADGSVASTPFDLSNANVANNVLNFGRVCKLQYSSGSSLSPNGSYSYSKTGTALPPHHQRKQLPRKHRGNPAVFLLRVCRTACG